MSRRLVVGAALVDDLERPTRLLTARRTEPPALAGGWEFPGGKVDPGEELLEALAREIDEELGVQIHVGPTLLGPLDGEGEKGAWPLGTAYAMHVWLATVTLGEARPIAEHDQIRWVTKADLYDVPWLPDDLPVVRAVESLMS